jgi:hypothetical protein
MGRRFGENPIRARHLFLRRNDAKVIHGGAIPVYGVG